MKINLEIQGKTLKKIMLYIYKAVKKIDACYIFVNSETA